MPDTEVTRADHLQWCKDRALEYLERGEINDAVASMLSDLGKHPETADAGKSMGPMGIMFVMTGDSHGVRQFIEGFR